MLNRFSLPSLILIASLTACGSSAATGPDALDSTPGTFVHQLTIDGLEREVIIYVPESAPATGAPAVFMFHGGTGTGQKFYNISGWREKADEEGLIAVFPTALVHCFYDTKDAAYRAYTSWNNGRFGTQFLLCDQQELDQLSPELRAAADHPVADDIAFVRATIDLLLARYRVDARRVYSAGFSNGAVFSGRVGLELSETIAAFAMASGQLAVDTVATRAISAMMHLGAEESGFPVDETAWDQPEYRSAVEDLLAALQLDSSYTHSLQTIDGVQTSWLTFESSLVGATSSLQALMIGELPHVYPNGVNHPIRMADLHWDFFFAHTLGDE